MGRQRERERKWLQCKDCELKTCKNYHKVVNLPIEACERPMGVLITHNLLAVGFRSNRIGECDWAAVAFDHF